VTLNDSRDGAGRSGTPRPAQREKRIEEFMPFQKEVGTASRVDPAAAVDRLERAFGEIASETGFTGGAAVALWRNGEPLLSLHAGEAGPGRPWQAATPCLIWSASKGLAAACTLHALKENGIPLGQPVVTVWPEFGASGKERTTLADLLAHRAGLAAIHRKGLAITDHDAVAASLAAQPPNWTADGSHGYGPRTFGFLLDEIVRRVAGETLGSYWERVFRGPLGLDLWFGLPERLNAAAATVIAPKSPPEPGPFSRAFADPSSLTRRALSEPGGPLTPAVMNSPALRGAALPSLGAISTADALARFYSLLASGNAGLFGEETLRVMRTTASSGPDRVLVENTSFSAGFMTNVYGVYGPSPAAFGHPGAGGSLAFADPALGLGFAFIPSAMQPGALPGPRTRRLVTAVYGV
jgi:CubicO group peptidase (beta-lactamase class C family)